MKRVLAACGALVALSICAACASILGIEDTVAPASDSGPAFDAPRSDASEAALPDAGADAIADACANACTPSTAAPCVLACGQSASDLTTTGGQVVWVNTGASAHVSQADESTGAAQVLTPATSIAAGAHIAAGNGLVFYTNGAALEVVKINQAPILMTTAPSTITSVAVAGAKVGYTFGTNVSTCPAANAPCAPSPIATNLSSVTSSIVGNAAGELFWYTPSVQLWWCKQASCPNNFVNNPQTIIRLAWVDATSTLLVLGGAFAVTPWTFPTSNGTPIVGSGNAHALAANGDHVYVATDIDVRRSIAGAAFSVVATGAPTAIATDSVWVVWIDGDKIMRAPR